MNKFTVSTYLGLVLLLGYIVFSLLGNRDPLNQRDLMLIVGYIVALGLWQWSEGRLHRHHQNRWGEIRAQGKHLFVLLRCVLLRGTVLAILFIGPVVTRVDVSWAFAIGILILLVTISRGYQEWADCEAHYQASLLRDTAESIRVLQN